MKILLIGEYSNVHATLAEGLKHFGHEVTVMSNGDFWKNYPRDINLVRTYTKWGGIKYLAKLYRLLPRLRGFDIVQLINPMFLELKAERIFPIYHYLRRHNRKVILCGFGMDWYWVNTCCTEKPLRYSDFNIGNELRTDADALKERKDWLGTAKERLNKEIANDCDGILTGLYEYHVCYQPVFPEKTTYIPYPIKMENPHWKPTEKTDGKIKIFIGINKTRSAYKGTDIMLEAALELQRKYPEQMEVIKVESVPFETYQQLLNGSDAILDQLYSYTPSMNSLLAMSKGIVCIGGGEPENYELIGEKELRPIINVQPTRESVYHETEQLILHPERLAELKRQSVEYIRRHHDYIEVAKQYVNFYKKLLEK